MIAKFVEKAEFCYHQFDFGFWILDFGLAFVLRKAILNLKFSLKNQFKV